MNGTEKQIVFANKIMKIADLKFDYLQNAKTYIETFSFELLNKFNYLSESEENGYKKQYNYCVRIYGQHIKNDEIHFGKMKNEIEKSKLISEYDVVNILTLINAYHRYGAGTKELVYFQRFFKDYLNGMTTADMCKNYVNTNKNNIIKNLETINSMLFTEEFYAKISEGK